MQADAVDLEIDDCQICGQPQIGETLTLVKVACGPDVSMCRACVRSPATPEWVRRYVERHLLKHEQLTFQLSA